MYKLMKYDNELSIVNILWSTPLRAFRRYFYNIAWGSFARLLMVQFTNNDGMCNDAFYVNVNLALTAHRGLRPLLFTNSVWVL